MMMEEKDEQPPLLGSWNRLYLLLVAVLALFILLFYLFANHYQ